MEAKRKEGVVTSSAQPVESSCKDASREEQEEGAGEGGPQSAAQSQGQGHIQAADQESNPTTSAGEAEVPPPYASTTLEPSSSDGVAVPSTTN